MSPRHHSASDDPPHVADRRPTGVGGGCSPPPPPPPLADPPPSPGPPLGGGPPPPPPPRTLGAALDRRSAVLFGQSLSLALALTSAASSTVEVRCGVNVPICQTGIVYAALSLHLIPVWSRRPRRCGGTPPLRPTGSDGSRPRDLGGSDLGTGGGADGAPSHALPLTGLRLRAPWWAYLAVAFLDVESNYLLMLAFRYTSLTSASLFATLTVPSSMAFSGLMLGRTFASRHLLGAAVCVAGGCTMILSDLSSGGGGDGGDREGGRYPHAYMGDLYAIAGACLYGLTDTMGEYAVKNVDRVEYLGMLGLFGAAVSLVQGPLVEMDELERLAFRTPPEEQRTALLVMLWYVACLVYYYVAASHFLVVSDVTMLNLSLQTCEMWEALFSVAVQRFVPRALFFVAAITAIAGVIIYETGHARSVVGDPKDGRIGSDADPDSDPDPDAGSLLLNETSCYGSGKDSTALYLPMSVISPVNGNGLHE